MVVLNNKIYALIVFTDLSTYIRYLLYKNECLKIFHLKVCNIMKRQRPLDDVSIFFSLSVKCSLIFIVESIVKSWITARTAFLNATKHNKTVLKKLEFLKHKIDKRLRTYF